MHSPKQGGLRLNSTAFELRHAHAMFEAAALPTAVRLHVSPIFYSFDLSPVVLAHDAAARLLHLFLSLAFRGGRRSRWRRNDRRRWRFDSRLRSERRFWRLGGRYRKGYFFCFFSAERRVESRRFRHLRNGRQGGYLHIRRFRSRRGSVRCTRRFCTRRFCTRRWDGRQQSRSFDELSLLQFRFRLI